MEHGDGPAFLAALEDSAIGAAMRQSLYLYPTVETLHILGFVLLVGSIAAYDLRLLGFGRALPADSLARLLVPCSVAGFLIVLPTGLLLFVTEATSIIANPVFPLKLGFIAIGLANAAIFHVGPYRAVADWRTGVAVPLAARAAGAVSLAAWVGALVCGRLLAYF